MTKTEYMGFEISINDKDDIKYGVIVSQVEKLDTNVAPDLKSELVKMNGEGVANIIIDLSGTRYCDSSGLSAILVASRLCKTAEGSFVLCGLQPQVEKLINISQLNSVLSIVPTSSEAVEYLLMEAIGSKLEGED
jgi:anti-sigma B factor antagonist